jgi:ATP-dependent exoDNAse (exonuclease V) beta subunit
VLLAQPDGSLAEGVVDLAFREVDDAGRARWIVVDFKTDRDLGARQAAYAWQLRLYVEAIARATGEPASGALFVV